MYKLEDIGFYTLSNYRCHNASEKSPIWRGEIILTDKCNFKCPYCRGIGNTYKGNMDLHKLESLLNYLASQNIQHIRFSGGEPTLYPHLHRAVKLCKNIGAKRIAISTNGSAELEYYKSLIDAGINDFSISLDACCSSTADLMAGRFGGYDRLINNINVLSKLSYLTVGIVYNEKNMNELQKTIEIAIRLGVSDIRIIPASQFNKEQKLKSLNIFGIERFPILKYRLSNKRKIRGLEDGDNIQCPLVLDDIMISNNYHFPCVIYFREQGIPIGNLNSLEDIREERKRWYINHNCLEDEICKNNCLDVCRAYNNEYSKHRKAS